MNKCGWLVFLISVSGYTWAGNFHKDKLYAVDEAFDELVIIDPCSAQISIIGPVGLVSISSLASNAGGVLYGTDTYSLNLVTLDKQTGQGLIVGPTYTGQITALAFSKDGTLYGAEAFAGRLVTLDPETGAASPVGDFGVENRIITGLAFDAQGTLYGVASGDTAALDSHLVSINTASGAASIIGPLGKPYVTGLSFRSDGTLYGITRENDELLIINPATGAASSAGTLENGDRWIGGIEFVSVTVEFDIKPASGRHCIRVDGNGVIPVSIFGSEYLNVEDINLTTLKLSGLKLRMRSGVNQPCSLEDLNNDGYLDLMCQFEDSNEHWKPGYGVIVLNGELYDGTPIVGKDFTCAK